MDINFYQNHLNRVSRSFALCIAELRPPLKNYVSLTYLICRIIDTVEDSEIQYEVQKQLFKDFCHFLETKPDIQNIENWTSQIPRSIPEGEFLLIQDLKKIIDQFHDLPGDIQTILIGPLRTMAFGMSEALSCKENNQLSLQNIRELNEYCFYVAGIVGEILTRLAGYVYQDPYFPNNQLQNSLHLGLFLQKINILKDQKDDGMRGVSYFRHRQDVVFSLKINAIKSKEYLNAIPTDWVDFKIFSAFSFALGLLTLPHLIDSEKNPQKVSRTETLALLQHLKDNADNLELTQKMLNSFFDEYVYTLPEISVSASSSRLHPLDIYEGIIPKNKMIDFFSPR